MGCVGDHTICSCNDDVYMVGCTMCEAVKTGKKQNMSQIADTSLPA